MRNVKDSNEKKSITQQQPETVVDIFVDYTVVDINNNADYYCNSLSSDVKK
jgi:hypothetical protein